MKLSGNVTECLRVDEDTVRCNGIDFSRTELLQDTSAMFWIYLCVYICLVLFAGESRCQSSLLAVLMLGYDDEEG